MKNTLFLAGFSSLFLLASCGKKSYTCRCDGISPSPIIYAIEARSKSKAEQKCKSYNDPNGGVLDGPYNCKLQ